MAKRAFSCTRDAPSESREAVCEAAKIWMTPSMMIKPITSAIIISTSDRPAIE